MKSAQRPALNRAQLRVGCRVVPASPSSSKSWRALPKLLSSIALRAIKNRADVELSEPAAGSASVTSDPPPPVEGRGGFSFSAIHRLHPAATTAAAAPAHCHARNRLRRRPGHGLPSPP